jgi:hypothetical protein
MVERRVEDIGAPAGGVGGLEIAVDRLCLGEIDPGVASLSARPGVGAVVDAIGAVAGLDGLGVEAPSWRSMSWTRPR